MIFEKCVKPLYFASKLQFLKSPFLGQLALTVRLHAHTGVCNSYVDRVEQKISRYIDQTWWNTCGTIRNIVHMSTLLHPPPPSSNDLIDFPKTSPGVGELDAAERMATTARFFSALRSILNCVRNRPKSRNGENSDTSCQDVWKNRSRYITWHYTKLT